MRLDVLHPQKDNAFESPSSVHKLYDRSEARGTETVGFERHTVGSDALNLNGLEG
jgi:hypothetical protein